MENTYDKVPYLDLSYVHTHPDRLATLGTLLGMSPQPVTNCRVLEIGCAAGGNLIPMAYDLPQSEFVGLDYSARQIEEGQAWVAALGITNLTLVWADLVDIGDELGKFDYIVAHGVYSWVAKPVRDKLLAICKRLLTQNGVVYISYNTYPGWHFTGVIRDAMLFRTRDIEDLAERAVAARSMARFLADNIPQENNAYAGLFQNYLRVLGEDLKATHDGFLLHDELEEVNDPVYFYQFVEHAQQYGLRYLVEAELKNVLPDAFGPEVAQRLQQLSGDAIELEQYMDFLRNRMFRQTLLCHAELPVTRMLRPDRLQNCFMASAAQPVVDETGHLAAGTAQFRSKDGATLTTDHPVTQVAMLHLGKIWPRAILFGNLLVFALSELGRSVRLRCHDAGACARCTDFGGKLAARLWL